jgi:hypothetical protein
MSRATNAVIAVVGSLNVDILADVQRLPRPGETVVATQLTRRFGPLPDWATARLQAADVSQLEQWADRVLDAPSLEAVFIGH